MEDTHTYDASNRMRSDGNTATEGKIDTVTAANDLLRNGILVETSKGLVCLPLKDVLLTGVGGLKLSVEDFQNVAAQLLSQHSNVRVTSAGMPESAEITEESLPLEVVLEVDEPLGKSQSQLQCSSGKQVAKGVKVKPAILSLTPSSTTAVTTPPQQKRRGGWPKGRKRKPQLEMHPPKAPATGYVLYLNEKRKNYKDLPFPEVTKLLGNEWSKLSLEDKKVYLERAEVDKKRYREELKAYRQSDAYQAFLNRKRAKYLQGNGTEESDMDATDEIEDEDNEELYCRTCDQWFSSLHNKKEHLYGRQHLQSIAGDFTKKCQAVEQEGASSAHSMSTSLDESSMDGTAFSRVGQCHGPRCHPQKTATDMDGAMYQVLASYEGRESEISVLMHTLGLMEAENTTLVQQVERLKRRESELLKELNSERKRGSNLEQQLLDLLTVSTTVFALAPGPVS